MACSPQTLGGPDDAPEGTHGDRQEAEADQVRAIEHPVRPPAGSPPTPVAARAAPGAPRSGRRPAPRVPCPRVIVCQKEERSRAPAQLHPQLPGSLVAGGKGRWSPGNWRCGSGCHTSRRRHSPERAACRRGSRDGSGGDRSSRRDPQAALAPGNATAAFRSMSIPPPSRFVGEVGERSGSWVAAFPPAALAAAVPRCSEAHGRAGFRAGRRRSPALLLQRLQISSGPLTWWRLYRPWSSSEEAGRFRARPRTHPGNSTICNTCRLMLRPRLSGTREPVMGA
jgi:hypothetical protein